MFRRILVPVDFTTKSERAVRVAARIAAGSEASLTLLHVIERVDAGEPGGLSAFYRKLESLARRRLADLVRRARPAAASAEILYGRRVDEILRFAEARKIDLIVMSSHRVARRPGEGWG